MSEPVLIALVGLAGIAAGAFGQFFTESLKTRQNRKQGNDTAQDKLIDQLQEELTRYRDDNDKRVERLENRVEVLTEENRGYRAFIGVQRDHMAEHGVPLPPWPDNLPR